jgi:DNA invertase Pin-like site-specific DNA recombinase
VRVALYTRVSTTDKGQTIENQVLALRADCEARKEDIALEGHDYISGAKQSRPGLDRIFAAAEAKQFDVLVVWSLDRLTREGAFRALEIIQNLGKLGIGFRSLQEPHFDTCGPFKDAIIAIAATLAKLEREKIVERVKAGLERVKAEGRVLGPPRIIPHIAPRVLELAAQGWKAPRIASTVKYRTHAVPYKVRHPSLATVRRILAEHRNTVA